MKGTIEAERLRRQGIDVVDLGAGEPDFPTPRAHHRRRARGARRQLHEVHRQPGHRPICARRWPRATAGLRRRATRRRSDHHGRRQAGAVSRRDGALRTRRRGHHARAGLADASSSRSSSPARRRSSCARTPTTGSRSRPTALVGRGHAADARHRHQLAGQSDGRAAVRGRGARARGRGGAARPVGRRSISATTGSSTTTRRTTCRRSSATPCAIGSSWPGRRRRPTR